MASSTNTQAEARARLEGLWCNAARAGTLSPMTQAAALGHRAAWLDQRRHTGKATAPNGAAKKKARYALCTYVYGQLWDDRQG